MKGGLEGMVVETEDLRGSKPFEALFILINFTRTLN